MSQEEGDSVLREVGQDTQSAPFGEFRADQEHGCRGVAEELVRRVGDPAGQNRVEQGRDTQRDPVRQGCLVVEQFQRADPIAAYQPRRVETRDGGGARQDEEDDGHDDDGHGDEDGRNDTHRPRGTVPPGRQGSHNQQSRLGPVPHHRFEEVAQLQAEQRPRRLAARRRRLGQKFEERSGLLHRGEHDGTGARIRAQLGLLGAASALSRLFAGRRERRDIFRFRLHGRLNRV